MVYQLYRLNHYWKHQPKDPVSYIIMTHLYVEHAVNFLIYKKCKNQKKILEDHRTWTFSVKLDLLNEMNILYPGLYEDIRVLNRLRNEVSHTLDVNYKTIKNLHMHFAEDGVPAVDLGTMFKDGQDDEKIRTVIFQIGNNCIIKINTIALLLTKDSKIDDPPQE